MKTFLEHVAQDILSKWGTDLSRTAVVFPNKRASLFLNDALARAAGRPLWSPAYITISDLFRRHSTLQVADPIKLICDLHRTYTEVTGFDETLDHFYGWGQVLITDFDDIDKNMAEADKVFANLRDIREFDDVSYLTQEQRDIIRKFFSNFSDDHNTLLKERFLRLWSRMGDIYTAFNARLQQQGLAYEGALYRQVVETGVLGSDYDRYIFIGFNLLQEVERRLFRRLKGEGRALFYWDFDHYYMHSEAGHFISQYLSDFPNELPLDRDDIYRNFQCPKQLRFVSASTEDVQARYVGQWLMEDNVRAGEGVSGPHGGRIADGRRTAIVLCNEGLLQTVVHQLPPDVEHVNITTGYPLWQTPVASLVLRLIKNHSLEQVIARVTAEAQQLLTAHSSLLTSSEDPLNAEACFRTYTLLNRLKTLQDCGDLQVDAITMQRLVGQLIQQTSIPFHGEPAVGLQVMGVLETRNLDFRHLLLLSTNEGNLPRGLTDSSFIPYSIRRAFGLTTADHKAAIYAYYFNRLLSRATDVTLVYNNATTDGQAAEMSRFMLQLMVEDHHHHISHFSLRPADLQAATSPVAADEQNPGVSLTNLQSPVTNLPLPSLSPFGSKRAELECTLHPSPSSHHPSPIAKTSEVMDTLRERFSQGILSPTAINRFMRCPLQFYFCYVEGLREPDDTEDGVIDNRIFGNIFHNAAQFLYEGLSSNGVSSVPQGNLPSPITAAMLDRLLKSRVDIERAVDRAFNEEFHDHAPTDGMAVINRQVIIHYLRQLVTIDRHLAPFSIIGLERDALQPLYIKTLGQTVTIGGRIDRLDMIDTPRGQQVRVIDYKTGAHRLRPLKSVDDIFDDAQLRNHSDYYLQTFLYARIVSRQFAGSTPVAPALLFIQHAGTDDYSPILKFGNDPISDVATADGDRFVELLMAKVNEMFDSSQPFTPTADGDRCRTCLYQQLCGL